MSTGRQLETRDDMMDEIEHLRGCLNQTAEIERENAQLRASIAELEGARAKLAEVERRYLRWANAGDDSDRIAVEVVDSLGDLFIDRAPAQAETQDGAK